MKFEDAVAVVGDDRGPSPGMITNIVFRLVLNLGAALACWIPMRLFHRNGELAGAAMVVATAILNFYYGVNSVIWPNNNIENWFKGYVWCDIQLVLWIPLETMNTAAICAVMQNIANQVSLMRASGLTCYERRRKHLRQALIIFPIPALQAVLYFFAISMRYNVSGIIGCQAVFQNNWVFLVFFLLPCPIFALAAAYFAAVTWWRYRQIEATCRRALYDSGNYVAQGRSARTKRKLYFMALTIVAPYCPMQLVFLFNNLRIGWPWSRTYSLAQLHASGWGEIDFSPSTAVSFVSMYINYIVFLEVVVFFLFFGGTKDAHELYRKYLRAVGVGKIFPRLNEVWTPSDRPPTTFKALWPQTNHLLPLFASTYAHSRSSSTYKAKTQLTEEALDQSFDDTRFLNIRLDSLDLERSIATLDAARSSDNSAQLLCRDPGIFRTNLASHLRIPRMPKNALARSRTKRSPEYSNQRSPVVTIPLQHNCRRPGAVHSTTNHLEAARDMDGKSGRDSAAAHRPRASLVFGFPLVGNSNLRLSDYGRGVISIRKDFASAPRELLRDSVGMKEDQGDAGR
ncbi:a-factor receptor [Gnomoniopsis smithogilvyi]|uniref:A-factor receptor n=1 Tax=Gnomoniopsis smithogilvyi TaxID=1191159 RepID=A0A9W8YS26_9PEZI|nr:a-factor receptor [Gnomoniopsis smithogilvyi]